MPPSRIHRIIAALLRGTVYAAAAILILVGLVVGLVSAAINTGWGKNQIRQLIVRQANQYLSATLEIGRLDGSLLHGITLGGIRLSRDGDTIISADAVELGFTIRELLEPAPTIRKIRLVRPHVVAAKGRDGRWNLATLIKREGRQGQRLGPGRPLRVVEIDIVDGDVGLANPLTYGAVHVPSRFASLNASFSFDYAPVRWHVNLASVAWAGDEANLTMEKLTGGISDGPGGWQFDALAVQTPRSAFTLSGRVNRDRQPTTLDLHVDAKRFAFQEWSGVLDALGHIAIESRFDLTLKGPPAALATGLTLDSTNGGSVQGRFVLDTSVDGWHGSGTASVDRLNLARWLNRADRPSDITGRLTFNLDLDLGHHFPRGSYAFEGPHVMYLSYEADALRARGTITATDALVAEADATAYGSTLHVTAGSIGIDEPHTYHFQGADTNMDLRKLPPSLPITRVESLLALDAFDVAGQFAPPSITGQAQLGDSEYLGARIHAGATGAIDTSAVPVRYNGEGDVTRLDIHRFGVGLDVPWMLDPRLAGVLSGHFHVNGAGGDSATMRVDGGGRLDGADVFGGRLLDADIAVHIGDGSVTGSYDGRLSSIDTAVAFADSRFAGSLTGTGRARFTVRDLLTRATALADYDVDGILDVQNSSVRGVKLDTGSITARLTGATLDVSSVQASGPLIDVQGSGIVELDGERSSQFEYNIKRADLSLASDEAAGRLLAGTIASAGHLTGPTSAIHLAGDASVSALDFDGTTVHAAAGQYDATIQGSDLSRIAARVSGQASLVGVLGRTIPETTGTVSYNNRQLDIDVQLPRLFGSVTGSDTPPAPTDAQHLTSAGIVGSMIVHSEDRAIDLSSLTLTVGASTWRLADAVPPPTIRWNDSGIDTMPLEFLNVADGAERATLSGDWRTDGSGALRLTATQVFLDGLDAASQQAGRPAIYGGVLDLDATLRGTRDRPMVAAQLAITEGRVRKLTYQRLGGRVDYADGLFHVDLRLDQGPGTWLTATGSVPLSLIEKDKPEQPVSLSIASSPVALGLLEGVTDAVRNVSGQITVNLNITGTSGDPRFSGSVQFADTGFLVTATGARYKNGQASIELAADRLNVEAFHLEDRNGRVITVTGSLGTHALTVGDLHIDAVARHFEILHDEFGTADVDAHLNLRGELDAPRVTGDITILSGNLKVDEIFERVLFQPYSTQEAMPAAEVDAITALDLWDRLSLDIVLHSRGTLRLVGDNVQVSQGTPLGLGSFNLRATGDLYLSKNRSQQSYVTGSFDSITGSYAFQGHRFDIDPTSSINFHGDLNPDLYVTVTRLISGVETRVTISGALHSPELRLSSTPPLEASDILSLIVFNTSTNDLSATEQQELAVRAGTLAYGFVATPLISALQRSIGLETLEIAPPAVANNGTRVTVGNELVPGLVAQFTREFGAEAYDEATVEYYISRIFRIRATFSDAGSLIQSPFLRIERAGVDLLFFFSF